MAYDGTVRELGRTGRVPVDEGSYTGTPRAGRVKGFVMVLAAAVFWGLSGTAAQVLFQGEGFRPEWLVTVRMGLSGMILVLGTAVFAGPRAALGPLVHPVDALRLTLFGIFGMLGVQYSYFASVAEGNAATATLLQYLAPAMIVLYAAARSRRMPGLRQIAAVGLALAGTFLLVTGGQIQALTVPWTSVVWGLASAVTLAFYTVYPGRLLRRYGAPATVGWAMVVGAAVPALGGALQPGPAVPGETWWIAWGLTAFVVFFGTLVSFLFYLTSLRFLTPAETSLLASAEPVSAVVSAALFLHVNLGMTGAAGAACILAAVVLLARPK